MNYAIFRKAWISLQLNTFQKTQIGTRGCTIAVFEFKVDHDFQQDRSSNPCVLFSSCTHYTSHDTCASTTVWMFSFGSAKRSRGIDESVLTGGKKILRQTEIRLKTLRLFTCCSWGWDRGGGARIGQTNGLIVLSKFVATTTPSHARSHLYQTYK